MSLHCGRENLTLTMPDYTYYDSHNAHTVNTPTINVAVARMYVCVCVCVCVCTRAYVLIKHVDVHLSRKSIMGL